VARLLIVHHSPTPHLQRLADAVVDGANHPDIGGVDVVVRAALEASVEDVLTADGYLLGTPANLGYMSGALKHFFDSTYESSLEVTAGRPWGLWIHGATDTTGARLAVEKVVTGLGWRKVAEVVELIGSRPDELERCAELGAVVAASTD
jgi:NAD(P)H-dependent FMN reductase